MSSRPRVTVLSRRAVEAYVWHASQFEFEDVVGEIEDVHLLAPPGYSASVLGDLRRGVLNRARRMAGRPRRGRMARPTEPPEPSEILFSVFAAPHEMADLGAIRPYLSRFSRKIAYVVELWSSQARADRDHLEQLRGFDHVFVLNPHATGEVEQVTGVPTTYLPYGTDVLRFAPPPGHGERPTAVTLYGRRPPGRTHAALVEAMAAGRLEYEYDTVRGPFQVTDHREHRLALARRLQRSLFSLVYRINDTPDKLAVSQGEESLTARYFEAAAAGAVILGAEPRGPEFGAAFDWEDALVPLPVDAPHVAEVIDELVRDEKRWQLASDRAVLGSLRRHDWAHRWVQMLAEVGLEPGPRVIQRMEVLDRRADEFERRVTGAA